MIEPLSLYSEDGIYGSIDYGSPSVSKGFLFAAYVCQVERIAKEKGKVLCLGSGNAYDAVKFLMEGFNCYIAELYHPKVDILKGRQVKAFGQNLPFRDKEFDLLFCCEMMEHVPEEVADAILLEAKRVSKEVFFTIATGDDSFHTHICIHNAQWWMNKFESLGFVFINAQANPNFTLCTLDNMARMVARLVYFPDGVAINAFC